MHFKVLLVVAALGKRQDRSERQKRSSFLCMQCSTYIPQVSLLLTRAQVGGRMIAWPWAASRIDFVLSP